MLKSIDDLSTVLKKFDTLHPHATIGELLNELMYRGHSFAGLEWDDRFRPELMKAADEISLKKTDDEAFIDAWKWTNDFYQSPSAQYGVTFTLRDALDKKRLDCVRATDMIASIYRNSGRVGMGHIRWSSATCGHSVAAHLVSDDLNLKVIDWRWPDAATRAGNLARMLLPRSCLAGQLAGQCPSLLRRNFICVDWTVTFGPKATSFAVPRPARSLRSIFPIRPIITSSFLRRYSTDRIRSAATECAMYSINPTSQRP